MFLTYNYKEQLSWITSVSKRDESRWFRSQFCIGHGSFCDWKRASYRGQRRRLRGNGGSHNLRRRPCGRRVSPSNRIRRCLGLAGPLKTQAVRIGVYRKENTHVDSDHMHVSDFEFTLYRQDAQASMILDVRRIVESHEEPISHADGAIAGADVKLRERSPGT